MAAETYCKRNKFGYCKFGETCMFLHVNELCSSEKCDKRRCSFRHPKECNYYKKYSNCKFGEWCKYDHVTSNTNFYESTRLNDEKYDNIIKEIQALKTEILDIKLENTKLKSLIESIESNKDCDNSSEDNRNYLKDSIEADKEFKCNCCSFIAKTENGLKIHTRKKHKQFVQLDGNVSSEDLDESSADNLLKVVFIGEDEVSAEAELRQYYIGEVAFDYSENIILIEEESGDIYDGTDHCYNNGKFKKYTFTFKLSNTFTWEDIKTGMFTDKVLELFII